MRLKAFDDFYLGKPKLREVVYRILPDMVQVFATDGTDFPLVYGNDSWFLPTPATYVVGRDGKITHAYVNPDFRYRLDPNDIVASLKMLKSVSS